MQNSPSSSPYVRASSLPQDGPQPISRCYSRQRSPMPRPTSKPARPASRQSAPPEVVSPIWLVKAIALTIVAALLCGYLTFCLLFYQGQWQLVLHPTRTAASPASIDGISYELVRFGPDESATPQLTGWWTPAASGSRSSSITILFLP